jgi:hypothetical protein
MHRVSLSMSNPQADQLRQLSKQLGVPQAELLRDALNQYLEGHRQRSSARLEAKRDMKKAGVA